MVVIYPAVHLIDLLKNLYYHHVTSAKLYEAIKYFARRQIIVSYNIKLNWTNLFQYKNLYYRNLMFFVKRDRKLCFKNDLFLYDTIYFSMSNRNDIFLLRYCYGHSIHIFKDDSH